MIGAHWIFVEKKESKRKTEGKKKEKWIVHIRALTTLGLLGQALECAYREDTSRSGKLGFQ